MFKYIDMPKLVAYYLREFTIRSDDSWSILYRFVMCLCLPFISSTFRRARINALAIAECTNSRDQITKLLNKLTSASVVVDYLSTNAMVPYTPVTGTAMYAFTPSDPNLRYARVANETVIYVTLNGTPKEEFEAYAQLLIPFYLQMNIVYA